MNDVDFPVERVLDGIEAAAAAGLAPVKVNMVVKRGVNEDSILPMARHFHGTGHILRFIEFMDVGTTNGWRLDDVVPGSRDPGDGRRRAAARARSRPTIRGEVARRWRYRDGGGEIGVIASVTRAVLRRLHARPALGRGAASTPACSPRAGHDLRALAARRRRPTRSSTDAVGAVWGRRDDRYSELRSEPHRPASPKVEMSYIGG